MRKEFKRNKKQKNNQASDKKEGHRLFLDEQYIRMAEEMERELFADGDSEIYESTDEEEEMCIRDSPYCQSCPCQNTKKRRWVLSYRS